MLANNFTRWHAGIFLLVWQAFTVLTFAIVSRGLDNARQRPLTVAATTAATVLGPMTGAISRGCQGCCLTFSLSLLPYCFSALAIATLAQFVRLPESAWLRIVRLIVWTVGLVVWFGGGIVSFGHALS